MAVHAGEFVTFYSDGLINAANEYGEAFGLTRLAAVLEKPAEDAQALVAMLLEEVEDFIGGSAKRNGDVTVVVLGRMARNDSAANSE